MGLTLVQLGNIPSAAGALFDNVGLGLGGGEEASLLAGSVIVYAFSAGLMETRLATRLFIIGWENDRPMPEAWVRRD